MRLIVLVAALCAVAPALAAGPPPPFDYSTIVPTKPAGATTSEQRQRTVDLIERNAAERRSLAERARKAARQ